MSEEEKAKQISEWLQIDSAESEKTFQNVVKSVVRVAIRLGNDLNGFTFDNFKALSVVLEDNTLSERQKIFYANKIGEIPKLMFVEMYLALSRQEN